MPKPKNMFKPTPIVQKQTTVQDIRNFSSFKFQCPELNDSDVLDIYSEYFINVHSTEENQLYQINRRCMSNFAEINDFDLNHIASNHYLILSRKACTIQLFAPALEIGQSIVMCRKLFREIKREFIMPQKNGYLMYKLYRLAIKAIMHYYEHELMKEQFGGEDFSIPCEVCTKKYCSTVPLGHKRCTEDGQAENRQNIIDEITLQVLAKMVDNHSMNAKIVRSCNFEEWIQPVANAKYNLTREIFEMSKAEDLINDTTMNYCVNQTLRKFDNLALDEDQKDQVTQMSEKLFKDISLYLILKIEKKELYGKVAIGKKSLVNFTV